jgi:hypothetical protein
MCQRYALQKLRSCQLNCQMQLCAAFCCNSAERPYPPTPCAQASACFNKAAKILPFASIGTYVYAWGESCCCCYT